MFRGVGSGSVMRDSSEVNSSRYLTANDILVREWGGVFGAMQTEQQDLLWSRFQVGSNLAHGSSGLGGRHRAVQNQ